MINAGTVYGTPASAGSSASSGLSSLASLASPALGLLGGIFSARSAAKRNKQQIALAREQMAFQERMSSTANQRAAKDMEAAGLNRILALGKPASSPGGAQAQVLDEGAPAVQAAINSARTVAEIANIKANTEKTRAETEVIPVSTSKIESETRLNDLRSALSSGEYNKVVAATEGLNLDNQQKSLLLKVYKEHPDLMYQQQVPIGKLLQTITTVAGTAAGAAGVFKLLKGAGLLQKWKLNSWLKSLNK